MIPRRDVQPDSSRVSSLLHTLRGEAFRRHRNLQGTRIRVPPSSSAQGPSLPPLFNTSESDSEGPSQDTQPTHASSGVKVAGPSPPPSWIPSSQSTSPSASPEWRARALSLILCHCSSNSPALAVCRNPRVPSLFQMCLYNLLFKWGGIPPEIFPLLPRHLLREYIRYSAVHAPTLPQEDLEALWAVDEAGSADGELIITGSFAASILPRASVPSNPILSEWDSTSDIGDPEPPPVLHTFIVLSSYFSSSLASLLPPTLTHLALLSIPQISLHKLPTQLPLITVLDLSFNQWVGGGASKITRVEWRKWTKLEVLGMRGCGLSDEDARILQGKVNQGRFIDVEIVWKEHIT